MYSKCMSNGFSTKKQKETLYIRIMGLKDEVAEVSLREPWFQNELVNKTISELAHMLSHHATAVM